MNMELTYHRKGDYQFPNLAVTEEPVTIGKYGMLRRTYLKENKKNWYQSMLLTGKLNQHLMDVEQTAQKRMEILIEQYRKTYPEPDKATDQMAWVAYINNLTAMAEENILTELVYN
ncbi:MAG: TnpV protein [Clostridia bacterium]|nr:TnpV protein [Clostridia bacterium]